MLKNNVFSNNTTLTQQITCTSKRKKLTFDFMKRFWTLLDMGVAWKIRALFSSSITLKKKGQTQINTQRNQSRLPELDKLKCGKLTRNNKFENSYDLLMSRNCEFPSGRNHQSCTVICKLNGIAFATFRETSRFYEKSSKEF